VRRLVRDAGEDLSLLLAHAEADVRGSGGPPDRARRARLRRTLVLLRAHGARAADLAAMPLLRGEDVMQVLRIGPGPEVGRALAELAELREAGTLRSRDEALAWLDRTRRSR
jgi:hypothetical protein